MRVSDVTDGDDHDDDDHDVHHDNDHFRPRHVQWNHRRGWEKHPPPPPATGFDATPGVITVTMTALDPNVILPAIGMGLGTFDVPSSTCSLVVSTTAVQVGTAIVATASIASSATTKFCVQVWDVNGFASGYVQNFTLTVAHQKLIGT